MYENDSLEYMKKPQLIVILDNSYGGIIDSTSFASCSKFIKIVIYSFNNYPFT